MVRRRWRSAAMQEVATPPWAAPDPQLHAQVLDRLEAAYARAAAEPRPDSYYLRDTRSRLDSADKWFREEETFLVGQRTGIPIREPFWDPDLIEFLVRVRPRARSRGNRAKALVRGPLARRFPDLDFDRQRKSWLGPALRTVVSTQAGAAGRALGGFSTLVDLGVIDRQQARAFVDDGCAETSRQFLFDWSWQLLNLEAWARAHA